VGVGAGVLGDVEGVVVGEFCAFREDGIGGIVEYRRGTHAD
jgi:hypothetical protein